MPNIFYRRGAAFEYACMDRLRKGGYFAWRASGSHGPADLIAIRPERPILLIQAKCSGGLTIDEWNKLYDLADAVSGIPLLAMKAKGHGADYIQLKGRRTKKHEPLKNLMQRYDPFGQGNLF